jgi:GT2 family glycosyltransferase
VLEDIELARRLWRAGLSGSVVDGSAIAHCKMYESNQELIDGYSKSLWRAFGSPAGALFVIALMVATSWLPLIAGILGNSWGWFAFFAISLSRLVAALRTASFWQSFLLHPLSVALLTYMVARSFRLKRAGSLTWRDRAIAT